MQENADNNAIYCRKCCGGGIFEVVPDFLTPTTNDGWKPTLRPIPPPNIRFTFHPRARVRVRAMSAIKALLKHWMDDRALELRIHLW